MPYAVMNEIVQHRDLFGQVQGLPDWPNDRRCPDADASGALPNVQRLYERRWRVAVMAQSGLPRRVPVSLRSVSV